MFGITILSVAGQGGDELNFPNDVGSLIEKIKNEDLENSTRIGFIKFFSKELIINPIPVLKLIAIKLARSWYATSQQWWEVKILLVQLLYLIPGLTGLIYLIKKQKDKIIYISFILSIIFYFWVITFFNVSIMRYMVPVMGLIMIFLAVAIDIVINKLIKKKNESISNYSL